MSTLSDAYAYCLTALKEVSRDHYLACLLMPEAIRSQMAALFLFEMETARIRELVREPIPGEIRLQWWRDLLESDGDGADSGPLAHALKDVIARNNLPIKPFQDLLDARIFDLYDDPMGSVDEFELYAGETSSSLIQLGLVICDPEHARENADAAGHAGVAVTVARVLRSLATSKARGQIYIPQPMLTSVGLERAAYLQSQGNDERMRALVEVFAGFGLDHLEKARQAYKPSKMSRWPFLSVALSGSAMQRSRKRGAAILDGAPVERGPLARQWRLWRAAVSNRF
ncbi:phytoene/squalene synthase family protein [Rhizobium sp. L1K21]|uniref:phytoene/squalene synthase family protein n=1 Tax=Rhizobium sp. L1K21 TaxID=2954933 RepID=UPI002091E640|nr:phytoene/squalene synthase family protein [Rhizobium sp. L1K21]MCO6186141.1 phytoene/squalene synthase family protein [Rhizobium sp. L1K21]